MSDLSSTPRQIDARLSPHPFGRGPATGKLRGIPDSRSALLIGDQTDMLHPFMFIEPCLPTISRTVPTGRQWAYEIKPDGFRFICWRADDRVRVFSRQGNDWRI
jgi:ATP-dependent DNA ligase